MLESLAQDDLAMLVRKHEFSQLYQKFKLAQTIDPEDENICTDVERMEEWISKFPLPVAWKSVFTNWLRMEQWIGNHLPQNLYAFSNAAPISFYRQQLKMLNSLQEVEDVRALQAIVILKAQLVFIDTTLKFMLGEVDRVTESILIDIHCKLLDAVCNVQAILYQKSCMIQPGSVLTRRHESIPLPKIASPNFLPENIKTFLCKPFTFARHTISLLSDLVTRSSDVIKTVIKSGNEDRLRVLTVNVLSDNPISETLPQETQNLTLRATFLHSLGYTNQLQMDACKLHVSLIFLSGLTGMDPIRTIEYT
jgi:hypothetical protein